MESALSNHKAYDGSCYERESLPFLPYLVCLQNSVCSACPWHVLLYWHNTYVVLFKDLGRAVCPSRRSAPDGLVLGLEVLIGLVSLSRVTVQQSVNKSNSIVVWPDFVAINVTLLCL
jgi:hypothetical protein